MKGKLYGVGVGPGDPDLITLKAVKIIKGCGIIAVPAKSSQSSTAYSIALKAVPEIREKAVINAFVPMVMDRDILENAYNEICCSIAERLDRGVSIAFLNLGDPTLYGTYMSVHKRIRRLGYECEIVSGVTSFCASAAALHTDIASRNEEIHILPGMYNIDEIEVLKGTKIIMKSGGKIGEVANKLSDLEKKGKIKTFAVSNCGMDNEKIYNDINDIDENAGYFTTIIVKETLIDSDNK